jgi:hypothetical protein
MGYIQGLYYMPKRTIELLSRSQTSLHTMLPSIGNISNILNFSKKKYLIYLYDNNYTKKIIISNNKPHMLFLSV